jgi:polar amino acid transport system substrate-binding protein
MKLFAAGLIGSAFLVSASLAASQAGASGAAVYTKAQADAGAKTYAAQCSRCHGAKLEGVSAPALSGSGSGLAGDTVAAAYTFISTQMPAGNPGSLSSSEYSNVTAYILSRNGHVPGTVSLTPATAKKSTLKI